MFIVLFEVQPKADRWDDYLGLAAMLRPELVRIAGFIDNERFRSERTEGRLLSLSTWADEKALIRWRTQAMHHGVQEKGRSEVLADYHLRVGEVMSDTHPPQGLPIAAHRLDATEAGAARSVTVLESAGEPPPLPAPGGAVFDAERYTSITTAGKSLALISWCDQPQSGATQGRIRTVRIIRDYGMRDRREAPQYYPPVA